MHLTLRKRHRSHAFPAGSLGLALRPSPSWPLSLGIGTLGVGVGVGGMLDMARLLHGGRRWLRGVCGDGKCIYEYRDVLEQEHRGGRHCASESPGGSCQAPRHTPDCGFNCMWPSRLRMRTSPMNSCKIQQLHIAVITHSRSPPHHCYLRYPNLIYRRPLSSSSSASSFPLFSSPD